MRLRERGLRLRRWRLRGVKRWLRRLRWRIRRDQRRLLRKRLRRDAGRILRQWWIRRLSRWRLWIWPGLQSGRPRRSLLGSRRAVGHQLRRGGSGNGRVWRRHGRVWGRHGLWRHGPRALTVLDFSHDLSGQRRPGTKDSLRVLSTAVGWTSTAVDRRPAGACQWMWTSSDAVGRHCGGDPAARPIALIGVSPRRNTPRGSRIDSARMALQRPGRTGFGERHTIQIALGVGLSGPIPTTARSPPIGRSEINQNTVILYISHSSK